MKSPKRYAIIKNNIVFEISLIIILIITTFLIINQKKSSFLTNSIFNIMTQYFSWLYLLVMLIFVIFVTFLALSKYGNLKLGPQNAMPEYSTFSWFAMLFCAGMGVGLVFWGISEPISHYIAPIDIEPYSIEAVDFAFKSVFMHWGIQPWACYAIVGLALAYYQFRKGYPGLISSILKPLIGEKNAKGLLGNLIDILAVFATVAGVATSLGMGVMQITSGLNSFCGIANTLNIQIIIILSITIIFIASALSGIGKGVKVLSNINIVLAISFMILAISVGPKIEMLNNLVGGIGKYINYFIEDSLAISAYKDNSWIGAWRVFYWAWWIAWAPFVGIFIARISYGRTIREFIIGVVLVPTIASVIWFTIFGTLGISLGMDKTLSTSLLEKIALTPETGLFIVLQKYPLGQLMSLIAILLLFVFFITSADSGTFVLAMLSSNGNMNPPNKKKIVWGIIQTLLSISLLIAGGLKPLQTISIIAAFPFIFIMLGACISLLKSLRQEDKEKSLSNTYKTINNFKKQK